MTFYILTATSLGFPGCSDGKESASNAGDLSSIPGCSDGKESDSNAGDLSSIPGLGRSSGEGNGYPLQYS